MALCRMFSSSQSLIKNKMRAIAIYQYNHAYIHAMLGCINVLNSLASIAIEFK